MSVLFLCTVLWWSLMSSAFLGSDDAIDSFQAFIRAHNKRYHPATAEYVKRRHIFMGTLRRIEWLNRIRAHRDAAVYGINEFSDLTPEEFQDLVTTQWESNYHGKKSRQKRETRDFKNIQGIPRKVDWRRKGIIGKIRNQDKCGACWAFSTIATIESMVALKTNVLEELSVQQMIDCSTVNKGCDGGDTCGALEWLSNNNIALVTEEEYPFKDETDGVCKKKSKSGIRIKDDFTCNNYTGDEVEILKLLASHGPLTAAVDATGWQDYLGGIIQYHCDNHRNHAVQIVGYDLTAEIPHYIVRNSWGTKFGVDGYLKIAIGKNLCAISEEISAINVIMDVDDDDAYDFFNDV